MDSLGKDSTLVNEKLRELVCINLLNELYHSPDFSKTGILKILGHIENNSKYREHAAIAKNVRTELTKLEKGYRPPAFNLSDLDGNAFDFSSLYGKPIYLSFITTWSYGCLKELELMDDLQEEYKGRIHFVSISLDEQVDVVQSFIHDKGYAWTFLFNGSSPALVSDFRIKTFPVFMFLDREGKLLEYPAFKPSEIIRDSFDRQLNQN
jgi:thiol-disulfide isomerase/thioredoxin